MHLYKMPFLFTIFYSTDAGFYSIKGDGKRTSIELGF